MRAEVVAIGTELLLGQITDTNSSWIGEQLALAGIDCHRQVKVGDNLGRIVDVLHESLGRADAVICCGGLGPTQDDLTRWAIAEVMGVDLHLDDVLADRIAAMFASRGREMPANNFRQAEVPEGAWPMDQQPGTAAGLVCPVGDDKVIYAVPGVPSEMRVMVEGTVIPDLRRRAGSQAAVIRSRTVRTWGWSESHLAEVLAPHVDRLDAAGHATIAYLASGWEGIKVRITAKAPTAGDADAILDDEVATVADLLGDVVFSTVDQPMERVVLDALAAAGLSVAVAESLTGGLVAARLTEHAGASEVVRGGVVSYASAVKFELLGVPEGPVVTEDAARAMAEGVATRLGADVGLATTGVAGPADAEGLPPGTVCLAVWIDGSADAITVRFPGDRTQVRQFSVISLLDLLRRRLAAR